MELLGDSKILTARSRSLINMRCSFSGDVFIRIVKVMVYITGAHD